MAATKRLFYVLLSMVLAVAFSAPLVAAQTGIQLPSGEDVLKAVIVFIFGDTSGIPDSWMTYGGFMQNIIFPFIAVFVVMYGILTEIRIFHEAKVKAILALIMAFVGGYYVLISMRGWLVLNGVLGTWGFGILMLFGIVLWVARGLMENYAGLGKPYYALTGRQLSKSADRRIRELKLANEVGNLEVQLAAAWLPEQIKNIKDLIDQKNKEIKRLQEEEERPAH